MSTFLKILVFVLTVAVITASLAFSSRRLSRVKCGEVQVIIAENSPRIMEEEELAGLIGKLDGGLLNRDLYAINTEQIERGLEKISSVRNAEVYRVFHVDNYQVKGKLTVEIEQREPMFRIVCADDDYYMDCEGVRIDCDGEFTAKVLVVTGEVSEKFAGERLVPLIRFIDQDDFWKTQIQQIHVVSEGEIQLVPLVGAQLVEFGEPEGYLNKFRNLKALYEQGFLETGWARYDTINLKFENQIVCTKK